MSDAGIRAMASHHADAEANRRWLDTQGHEGAPAQWIGEVLPDLDLRGAVLVESTLLGTQLAGALLAGADLSRAMAGGAVFDRADGREARFVKAELTEARFASADLSGASFLKATLLRAEFVDATLERANLEQANCADARFRGANLRSASLHHTDLSGADLAGADLSGARFSETRVDAATRLDGCIGLDRATVESVIVGPRRLEGPDAVAWLSAQATRRDWTVNDLQLWLLAKMTSARVRDAVATLGLTIDDMRRVAAEVGRILDEPGHAAAQYRRILGPSLSTRMVAAAGAFAGSTRMEYRLPLWPGLRFVVNEDRDGIAWGVGFDGPDAALPVDLSTVSPWQWSADRLLREATDVVVEEAWSYDLEAVLTFPPGGGCRRFRARFDLGLLQAWTPIADG